MYHISKNNIFALIQLIGKDTTGALTFYKIINLLKQSFREFQIQN